MEIELDFQRKPYAVGVLAGLVLVALALVGNAVTPVEAGQAQVLTPERWEAHCLTRQVVGERETLRYDADALGGLLQRDPDPVEAMLLAQRIYAHHHRGTGVTAPAREALVNTSEVVALYASGGALKEEALASYQEAVTMIKALQ